MSIKTIAIAAAITASGSVAAADSFFEYGRTLERTSILDLGLVRAEGAGVVEIYDSRAGALGALLGVEEVHSGANPNVRVNLGARPLQDVYAVLKIDGQIVAQREYDVVR